MKSSILRVYHKSIETVFAPQYVRDGWCEFDVSDYMLEGDYTIFIEPHTKVKLSCAYTSSASCNVSIQVRVGAYAQLHMQVIFDGSVGLFCSVIEPEKHAQCTYDFFVKDGNINKKVEVISQYDRSDVAVAGAYVLSQDSSCSIITNQLHRSGHANSSTVAINGIITDTAKFSYQGNIQIDVPSSAANAHQYNKNITLSETVHVTARPGLYVLHNDVTCSHASATGKLDEEAIMYAQSRGLSAACAQKIIVGGLLRETISDRRLQEHAYSVVEKLFSTD